MNIDIDLIREQFRYILDTFFFSKQIYRKELYNIISKSNEISGKFIDNPNSINISFSKKYIDLLIKYNHGTTNNMNMVVEKVMQHIVDESVREFVVNHDDEIVANMINIYYIDCPPKAREILVYFFQAAIYENMYNNNHSHHYLSIIL